MPSRTKAQLTELAEANNVDISEAKTNAEIEAALTEAGVELSPAKPEEPADEQVDEPKEVTAEQADEARELGIEPSGFANGEQLQERIEHVRAEKEAVGGDTSISEARK